MSQTHSGSISSAAFFVVYFLMADAASAPLWLNAPVSTRSVFQSG